MSTQSNAMLESFQSQSVTPSIIPATRLLYWSIRRELWENRSIYLAPLAVAAVALFGFSLSSIAGIWEKPLRLNPAQPQAPFDMAAGLMMLTGIVVSVFYCLDALHGERRDRSILFWKSLPVSDATTVLAKASIPLVILPLLTFAITVALQWLMLLMSSAVLLASGLSVTALWTNLLLPAAGFRMAAPGDISMGGLTAAGDCRGRADCLPHLAFRCPGGLPIDGRCTHGHLDIPTYVPHRPHDPYCPGSFPEQPGSVDRPRSRRGLPGSSGAATPLSGTGLSPMLFVEETLQRSAGVHPPGKLRSKAEPNCRIQQVVKKKRS